MVYEEYRRHIPLGQTPKPVVGFIVGQATQRGKVYGHAGAVWWEDEESAALKLERWRQAEFAIAPTLGDVGGLIEQAFRKVT